MDFDEYGFIGTLGILGDFLRVLTFEVDQLTS